MKINLGEVCFDYEIVTMESIELLGFDYTGTNKKKELSIICNEFIQYMYKECRDIYDTATGLIGYDSCSINEKMEETLYYMIGIKKPENVERLNMKCSRIKEIVIPENIYAKFCLSSRIDRLNKEIIQAYRSILQTENYFPEEMYGLEMYDRTFQPNNENSFIDFYIPIIQA